LIWVDPFLFDSTFPWFASPARAFSSAPTSIANPVQYSQTIRATLSQGSVGLVEVRKRPEIKAQQVGQSRSSNQPKEVPQARWQENAVLRCERESKELQQRGLLKLTDSIQWTYGQAHDQTCDKCIRLASHSPKWGPTIMPASATRRSPPIIRVRAIARGRVRQNGRGLFGVVSDVESFDSRPRIRLRLPTRSPATPGTRKFPG
jgi:hypothetical protein